MEKPPLPDAYLPLYRAEVRAVTGLSAGLLKRLILSGSTQFGAGVVQIFTDGNKIHIRFNPKTHYEFIRSKESWPDKQKDQETFCGEMSGGANGQTELGAKSEGDCILSPEFNSEGVTRKAKLISRQSKPTISGSVYLAMLRKETKNQ